MAQESLLPQDLMAGALLHFEKAVPIDDLALRRENRERLARVHHVYWQWIRNPFSVDYKAMLRQLVKGHYADRHSECRASQKDVALFEFVKENVTLMTRKEAQLKVVTAAEQAIRIGMDTDNVTALTKGGKLLSDVMGLDKPEEDKIDMAKVTFLPSVVVTDVRQVDESKENIDDEETKRILGKYGGYVDEKRTMIEERVASMEARSGVAIAVNPEELTDE